MYNVRTNIITSSSLVRYKSIVSYNGDGYKGWQIQPTDITIQGTIEKVLTRKFSEDVKLHASGRTDAGVHALGQVVHFDLTKDIEVNKLNRAINDSIPAGIRFISTVKVDSEFHSRYNIKEKSYVYKINTKEYDAINAKSILQYNRDIDLKALKGNVKSFIGEHDFASFTSEIRGETVRNILSIEVEENDGIVSITFTGNGFLNHMIRHMVGALLKLNEGRQKQGYIEEKLQNPSKGSNPYKVAGVGLYLKEVKY